MHWYNYWWYASYDWHATGIVGNLKQIGLKCFFIHWIIHQEALCGKFVKINKTMKKVISIVNYIRGGNKAQRHLLDF
jgi:hypothetical protein